jgi:2-hydroxychromene-2-carboxylate isomerase
MRAWYFDVISPFAYLQLQRMHEFSEVQPIPIVLGAVLQHCGQLGPAEIPSKRRFAYPFIDFSARQLGFPIRFPATHPFNPLMALRLICAVPAAQRWPVTHALFNHIWRDGKAADSTEALQAIAGPFGIADVAAACSSETVKQLLKSNTETAIANGVFGVPTIQLGTELFWGFDSTDFALHFLQNPNYFESPAVTQLRALPASAARNMHKSSSA